MILTLDNLDGLGAVDYSGCLDASVPVKIVRTLNEPSRLTGTVSLGSTGLALPTRRARLIATADNGVVLFTGYIATTPEQVYVGVGIAGSVYRVTFSAISDEWLLDRQTVLFGNPGLGQSSGALLKTLTGRTGVALNTAGVQNGRPIGVFDPEAAQNWSANAGALANSSYTSYRALGGALSLQPIGSVTHALNDSDGTLQIGVLKTASVKELANDVTVSGAIEPAAYVTELFVGDGTTAIFQLHDSPFIPAHTVNTKYLVNDSFDTGVFNPRVWVLRDPGSHLGFSSGGLHMTGGNGYDGQTTLTALDAVEMGGTLVIEAGNLKLNGACDGVLCGLYSGSIARADCFAGYNVRQSGGATIVTPYLSGAEVGTSYTILAGHVYTLRIRLHCAETQRLFQTYYAMVDGAVYNFGGGAVAAPMEAVFELVDLGVSSNTPATVLYDTAVAGSVPSAPAACSFAAVDCVQMFGSMGYCRVTRTGSTWVTGTLSSGLVTTRLQGIAGEGVDFQLNSAGKMTFFAGRIPVANEIVSVRYRLRQRAVARLQDAASVAREALAGASGTAAWLGRVVKPAARSAADCENAALAILSFASATSAALAGTYVAINPQFALDVWPGDVLAITSGTQTIHVLVRSVTIDRGSDAPEVLTYHMAFANDWAEGLGVKLSEPVAVDALLPQTALNGPATVLPNLLWLTVVSATGTALQIDAGTVPLSGGGFEVRRRDNDFGAGVDQDLVLRSPVRSFSIPREGQVEQYFVRMYDGSTPPVYSRLSSAVFTDVPVG